MKTKLWIALIAVALVLCVVLSVALLLPGEPAATARIFSGGKLLREVSLSQEQSFTVASGNGVNMVSVRDGKIAVTAADCPDHTCMDMGWRNSGTPIVCLPNGLVIEFSAGEIVDGAVG